MSPKSKTGPKIVLDLEEPEIKIGPRKLFSDWDLDWANRPKFVKSYKQAQKEFWAPGDFKKPRIGPELQDGPDWGLM